MIYAEWLETTKAAAAKDGKDFAVALLQAEDGAVVEADVVWLNPGRFPARFPGPLTEEQKAKGLKWATSWSIHRCARQPPRQNISLPPGKFLPGGLPDIKL